MVRVLDVLQGFRESIQDLSDLADMALDEQDDQSMEDVFVEILRMESQLSQSNSRECLAGRWIKITRILKSSRARGVLRLKIGQRCY